MFSKHNSTLYYHDAKACTATEADSSKKNVHITEVIALPVKARTAGGGRPQPTLNTKPNDAKWVWPLVHETYVDRKSILQKIVVQGERTETNSWSKVYMRNHCDDSTWRIAAWRKEIHPFTMSRYPSAVLRSKCPGITLQCPKGVPTRDNWRRAIAKLVRSSGRLQKFWHCVCILAQERYSVLRRCSWYVWSSYNNVHASLHAVSFYKFLPRYLRAWTANCTVSSEYCPAPLLDKSDLPLDDGHMFLGPA